MFKATTFDLVQHIKRPKSQTQIDFVFSNKPDSLIPRCNIGAFENAIKEINWSDCLQDTDVEDISHSVISAILLTISRFQKVNKTKHGQKAVLLCLKFDI